jgi:glycosyltransferase involved in cell wall biosynthesis
MPRLLSLNTYHYRRGGSDAVYFAQDEMFRQLGWQTAVMAMHHPRNEASPWSEFFVDEIEFGHSYGLMDKVAMASKVIYSFEARRKLELLLDRFVPDVVHAHCIYHHISPSVLPLLKARGIPVVMTAHDLKLACPSYKMVNRTGLCERCKGGRVWNVVRYRCVRDSLPVSALIAVESAIHKATGIYRNNLDRIVAPSVFMARKLAEWGWPEQMITHIPNYVDASRFQPSFEPGKDFVYFGRLQQDKGAATVIKAAMAAGVRLHVIGTGPQESELHQLASSAKDQVVFHGYLQGESLQAAVRACRASVLASEIYENAPMSVLESYAMGKPVIGAEIGGIPELIRNNETGLLFPSGDVSALAAQMRAMADMNDAEVTAMGRAGRQHVESSYSAQRYLDSLLQLYSDLGVKRARQDRFE